MKIVVLGAGGFIGGHLVARLLREGHWVIAVDIKDNWWQRHAYENVQADAATYELPVCDLVFDLAADMGGMGYIHSKRLETMMSARIALNVVRQRPPRAIFASSACVYPYVDRPLVESLVYTGMPEPGYGEEKLFSERLFNEAGYQTVRFHNVYGPYGSWNDGREKAPAAVLRKVLIEKQNPLQLWGKAPGTVRTFLYVDDAVEGLMRMMRSGYPGPVNLGSDQPVTIEQLARIAGYTGEIQWIDGPEGAPCRISENTLCDQMLGVWDRVSLVDGMRATGEWMVDNLR